MKVKIYTHNGGADLLLKKQRAKVEETIYVSQLCCISFVGLKIG